MVLSSMTTLAVPSNTFLYSVISSMRASRSIFAISAETVRFCGEVLVVDSSTLPGMLFKASLNASFDLSTTNILIKFRPISLYQKLMKGIKFINNGFCCQ